MDAEDPGTGEPGAEPVARPKLRSRSGVNRRGAHHRRSRYAWRYRRWPRRILVLANVVCLLFVVGAGSAVGYALLELNRIHRITVPLKPTPKTKTTIIDGKKVKESKGSPFTMLIVGADTRDLKHSTGLNIGNDQTNAEDLSDSIVLVRVSPSTNQLAILSIPRDLYVNVPGLGQQKINAAFAGGDPTRLIGVIEGQLHIPINHFAEINFDSFEQIADAIGGVEQYFPTPAKDIESGLNIPNAGCVNLQGAQALAFVRSRNYFYYRDGTWNLQLIPESDLGRIQRQQAFIKASIKKVERSGDLTDPLVLTKLISGLVGDITLDSTFSDSDIIHLAEDFAHINANTIPNLTYPVVNDGDGLSGVPGADADTIQEFENLTVPSGSSSTSTTTLAPPTTVAHSSVQVEVQNGSGLAGQSASAATQLRAAGYTVSGTSDAGTFNHTSSIIQYGTGGHRAAETLEASVGSSVNLVYTGSLSGNQLVLITGTAFQGLTGGGTSSTTTPTTTVPAGGTPYATGSQIQPDSSSFYKGVYIPPGRVPGQPVSTCGD